jgi:hypothetical protein
MSAAAPLLLPTEPLPGALCPVTLDDLAPLRAELVGAQGLLDDLLWVATDATSSAPTMPLEAQRADIDRYGASLRALLQLAALKVDVLAALVRLAEDQRRAEPRKAAAR